jgi:chromosome partitioning protein
MTFEFTPLNSDTQTLSTPHAPHPETRNSSTFPLFSLYFFIGKEYTKINSSKRIFCSEVDVLAKIITITNQKGGTGKTTTSSALVAGLHQRNARVLGVDLDPQGNLGFSLGLELTDDSPTVHDVLSGATPIDSAIVSTEYGDVLPSDITLSASDVEFTAPRREFLLTQQLDLVRTNYDFIIIDTPPSLNLLTVNAYVASDGLIVPMEAEILSLVGITQLKETIEAVRDSFNPNLEVIGILLNKYNSRLNLSRDVLDMAEQVAEQLGSHVLQPKIRRSVGVAQAPAYGQSVITYQPKSKPAHDLQQVVDLVAGSEFPAV